MGIKTRSRKAYGVIALVAILALSFSATAAFGAVKFSDADFRGSSTGTVLHADALEMGGTRVADVNEAFTGSQVDSAGIKAHTNEMGKTVSAAAASKRSYGRGSGLEVGLGTANGDPATIPLPDPAVNSAPPNAADNLTDVINVPGDPLAWASVLRGASHANWFEGQCILGRDISFGKGHAADVQLINTGPDTNSDGSFDLPLVATDADEAGHTRGVASSYSHEFMDVAKNNAGKAVGAAWGLSSEVRMTIAPITLFKGTANEVTLEFAGEWVLRSEAGGLPGTARIVYGPGDASVSTPLLRILQGVNHDVTNIITLDDIIDNLSPGGLDIDASPLVHLTIGEDPRAIGGAFGSKPPVAATGTSASAAVDVVRLTVLNPDDTTHAAHLRLGHMEVKSAVPAGGIDCGIPVTKSANPPGVTVNQSFVVTIKIDNPFGCDLTAVKVVDDITTDGDAKFEVLSTSPAANTVPDGANLDSGTIIWNNIGGIPKGGSKSVTTTIRAQGGGGVIKDIANVSAVLGNCEGEGNGNAIVGKSTPLQVPVVLTAKLPPTGVGTSSATILAALMLLSLAGVTIRQIRRHA